MTVEFAFPEMNKLCTRRWSKSKNTRTEIDQQYLEPIKSKTDDHIDFTVISAILNQNSI